MEIDPLFEVNIQHNSKNQIRLYYGQINRNKITRTANDVGCLKDWIGSFEQWMQDEVTRGRITESERREILDLNQHWQANRDPVNNGDIQQKLTKILRKLVS